MPASAPEIADIFRAAGPDYRAAHAGHLSLHQLKVMAAIVNCRTAALGGHVEGCDDCGHLRVAYNSCRNRHCPKCQGAAARTWLAEREADLLPVGYFHIVFTLPAEVADIAWQNKAAVYDLLFRAASETMMTIAADPRHLGARIGITAVLHTWGSAMTHHPHVHMIVPGGGFSLDGARWITSRPAFLLPVRVLGKLFRRLFLTRLTDLHEARKLAFFGSQADLADRRRFLRHLAPVRRKRWVVYAKAPFAGPEAVLAYLSRYTHRVAISNRRLIGFDETGVTFRYKDYRRSGPERQQVMRLDTDEFIRRFLLHVLPAASTASATTACSRAPPAKPTSSTPASCWPSLAVTRARRSGRATRCAATLSVLRRPHAHHRDLRALDATARATQETRSTRSVVVIRLGLNLHHAAATPLRRSTLHASLVRDGAAGDHASARPRRPSARRRSGASPSMQRHRDSSHRLAALHNAP